MSDDKYTLKKLITKKRS